MNILKYIKLTTIIIMSFFYIGVGCAHFIFPKQFLIIMPPYLPYPLGLVYISGFFEIIFGLLLLFKRFRSFAGWGLILLLLAVFPANVYLYNSDIARELYGEISKQDALVRMFFQVPLIIIAYRHTQNNIYKKFSYICVIISIITILYFCSILF